MRRHALSAPILALLAALAAPAAGQGIAPDPAGAAPAVFDMASAGDVLRLSVGHSALLRSDRALGTIVVGDDTIANATVGAGDAIILTGLAAGTTNLIVLGEGQEMLLSAAVAVVPAAGALRATITVMRGAEAPERFECRGRDCTPVAADAARGEVSFLLTPAPGAAAGAAPEAEGGPEITSGAEAAR